MLLKASSNCSLASPPHTHPHIHTHTLFNVMNTEFTGGSVHEQRWGSGGALIGSSYLDTHTHTHSISNQQFSAVFASWFMSRSAVQTKWFLVKSLRTAGRGRVTHSELWGRCLGSFSVWHIFTYKFLILPADVLLVALLASICSLVDHLLCATRSCVYMSFEWHDKLS